MVWRLGIIGVAIGTVIGMFVRTIEFLYYTSKYILDRDVWYSFKRLLVIAIEVVLVAIIVNLIPSVEINGYKTWLLQAVIVGIISSIVVLIINCIVYRDNVKNVLGIAKKILKRGK